LIVSFLCTVAHSMRLSGECFFPLSFVTG